MDAKLQRRVQRYGWDKAAPDYERYWADALRPAQDRLLELADLKAGERVVEVASGTGLVTFRAAAAVGVKGTVFATDLSDAMVASLTAAATARGLPQVSAQRMDAEQLEVPDGTFDAALCALGLMYVPDPLEALKEMRRALRPGGRAAVAVWGSRANCGWAEIFPIVEQRVASDVCPLFFQLGSGDALALTMELAEFTDIRAERIPATLRYATGTDACGAAFIGGPVALAYAHFGVEVKAQANDEYLQSIAGFKRGDGYEIPGEFVVTVGGK